MSAKSRLARWAVLAFVALTGCATVQQGWNVRVSESKPVAGLDVKVTHLSGFWFSVDVRNNTPDMVRLIWDESSVVTTTGEATRAIRGETRKINTGSAQPASPIPPRASMRAEFIGEKHAPMASTTQIRALNPGSNGRIVLAFDLNGRKALYEAEVILTSPR